MGWYPMRRTVPWKEDHGTTVPDPPGEVDRTVGGEGLHDSRLLEAREVVETATGDQAEHARTVAVEDNQW
jgi:hypothetical protein